LETPLQTLKIKLINFHQRHETLSTLIVFFAAFLFDIFTLGRVDDTINLIQQSLYLVLLGSLLMLEIHMKTGTLILKGWFQNFWKYHDLLVHFLFGSLLSAYTLFYYTSASALSSFIFLGLIAGLTLANEFPKFQQLGLLFRIILYNICLLSFFSFLYPIIIGHVGVLPFWLAILSSLGGLFLIWNFYIRFHLNKFTELKNQLLIPTLLVHLLFVLGYYTAFIPPVPVALKKIGVYYEVSKKDGNYLAKHLQNWWKFWNKESQIFKTRPGDKVIVMLSIFSPSQFKDKIFLKWYVDHEESWVLEDTIPLTILGGREEGFRGYGIKQNYREGEWKVVVETSDGREVGSLKFTLKKDQSFENREFITEVF